MREATFSAHKTRASTALSRRERMKLSMPTIEHESWRLPCTSVSARIKGWPSFSAVPARRSFPDQCIMFQNTQKMIPQHEQTGAGDKFHAVGKRSAWLSPGFVLYGRQWRLRSVQTCQNSDCAVAPKGRHDLLLACWRNRSIIYPLSEVVRHNPRRRRRLRAMIAWKNKFGSGFTGDSLKIYQLSRPLSSMSCLVVLVIRKK